MKKRNLISATLMAIVSLPVMAGGYLTNTNQSASFLRMPAQEAYISVEGAYYNPAGIGFLPNGWHVALNNQTAFQKRKVETTFAAFAAGFKNNGSPVRNYKGTSSVPVIPSLDVAYVRDRWFGSFHFGIVGGGGKCEFEEGLGTFESVVSAVPTAINALTSVMGYGNVLQQGYDMDTYMRGRQIYYGGQLNLGYRLNEKLSVSLGLRTVYASSNYYGYVKNMKFQTAIPLVTGPIGSTVSVAPGSILTARELVTALGTTMIAKNPVDAATASQVTGLERLGSQIEEVEVNCDRTSWGFAPIVGIHYHNGPLNIGARYEFKTRLHPTNKSTTQASQAALLPSLEEFVDGRVAEGDIPALLAVGVGYEFTKKLRANISGHYYFDKDATQVDNNQHKINSNTWEILAGVEYDITDRLTASLGGQSTNYGLGAEKEFINDVSFTTSSYSLGCGVKFKVNDRINLNLAYFKTFYYSTRKDQADYNHLSTTMSNIVKTSVAEGIITPAQAGTIQTNMAAAMASGAVNLQGSDRFDRTNDVIGIGIDFKF